MITDNQTRATGSYIEWGTIVAGTVLAIAISQVLLQFGIAVGIADMNDMRTNVPTRLELISAGIYVLIIQLFASTLGGYLAGRMRAPIAGSPVHEREIRDGIHGLLVWALGTVLVGMALVVGPALAEHREATDQANVAKDILQQRHTVSVILAFAAGATSLVSAVCAWAAATKGGDHRDNMVDHSRHVSFRK